MWFLTGLGTVEVGAQYSFQIWNLISDVLSSQSWQGYQNYDQAGEEEVKVDKWFG